MKRAFSLALYTFLVVFISSTAFVFAYTSPGKPQGFVNDFAGTISSSAKAQLEQQLSSFGTQTGIQIAVVTVSTLGDETIEMYAVKLFEEWGIGGEAKDTGVLFLIAPNDRQVRIEVGYGLEGVLTDAQSNGIIQKIIIPAFREGKMEEGIVSGTQAIIDVTKSEADYSSVPETSPLSSLVYFLQHFGFVFFIIIASVLGRTKSWWLGGVFGGIAGIVIGIMFGFLFTGILAIIGLTLLGLFFDFIVSKGHANGGGFWGGFGGGHGGSGGGFGGFGGGMSGGGGSSGRW